MAQLIGDRINNVKFKLGNRTDLTLAGSVAPGYISTIAIAAPGLDYQVEDQLEVIQAGAYGGFVVVTSVNGAGGITGLQLVEDGFQFSTASGLVLVGGNGTGATCNITATTIAGPSRIELWLRDAYINLASGIPFPDLESTITNLYTVQGVANYAYPPGVRAIKALTLYRSDGTVITCETKDIKYIRRMNSINQGAPSIWCDYNNQILFRPVPDNNGPYQIVLDVWNKPAIEDPISSSLIFLPDDWLEALDYAAAVRGHTELQEEDKAKSIMSLLYGYTDPSGKYTPGMIQDLQTRRQATAPYVDYGVQPQGKTQTYTSR